MGHLAPLVERQAQCTSARTPPLGARIQTTRASKNGAHVTKDERGLSTNDDPPKGDPPKP
eukprot:727413-Prorocentrum_minimum.AAC.1